MKWRARGNAYGEVIVPDPESLLFDPSLPSPAARTSPPARLSNRPPARSLDNTCTHTRTSTHARTHAHTHTRTRAREDTLSRLRALTPSRSHALSLPHALTSPRALSPTRPHALTPSRPHALEPLRALTLSRPYASLFHMYALTRPLVLTHALALSLSTANCAYICTNLGTKLRCIGTSYYSSTSIYVLL